jgi:hypothetical protein
MWPAGREEMWILLLAPEPLVERSQAFSKKVAVITAVLPTHSSSSRG